MSRGLRFALRYEEREAEFFKWRWRRAGSLLVKLAVREP